MISYWRFWKSPLPVILPKMQLIISCEKARSRQLINSLNRSTDPDLRGRVFSFSVWSPRFKILACNCIYKHYPILYILRQSFKKFSFCYKWPLTHSLVVLSLIRHFDVDRKLIQRLDQCGDSSFASTFEIASDRANLAYDYASGCSTNSCFDVGWYIYVAQVWMNPRLVKLPVAF